MVLLYPISLSVNFIVSSALTMQAFDLCKIMQMDFPEILCLTGFELETVSFVFYTLKLAGYLDSGYSHLQ